MGLRKSIVFIGSVLVLAACDSASAPTGPLSLHEGPAASSKKSPDTTSPTPMMSSSSGCVWVKTGEGGDSSTVCTTEEQ